MLHEEAKVELETYALQRDERRVKPFMLVIARDTTHAETLRTLIEHGSFHDGRYIGRVAIVHSQQCGSIQDEMLQRLLAVENPDEPTEIVIHVNMLGEGWDVTNLYTIVPLRTADSRTLVEQSIGRGLRLPYGRKTGVPAVDRPTIVAHDRFEEIIDYANRPDSLIRQFQQIVIGRDVPDARMEPVRVTSFADAAFEAQQSPSTAPLAEGEQPAQARIEFASPEDRAVASVMRAVARDFEYHPDPRVLLRPDVRDRFINEVRRRYDGSQLPLALADESARMQCVLEKTVEIIATRTIGIPRVVVTPLEQVRTGFHDFDLEVANIRLAPVAQEILVQHLQSQARHRVTAGAAEVEARLEDYVVRELDGEPDLAYEANAVLLYKLAGQLVAHLRSYLPDDDAVRNVLAYHGRAIASNVMAQLRAHRWQSEFRYEAKMEAGYHFPRDLYAHSPVGEPLRDFREPVGELSRIRQMRFGGFTRCLFAEQRFQSDPERRFAVLLENDADDSLRWFKPAPTDVRIFLKDRAYEPDFVVETSDAKYLAEPKAANEMESADVLEKARAAAKWCEQAGAFEVANGGKPWRYLLIPHDAISSAATLSGLASRFTVTA